MRSGFLPTAAAAVLLLCGSEASAQIKPLDRPDPKSITVPNLGFTPTLRDQHMFDTYFYFYKHGVSYETAFTDLDQCRMIALETGINVFAPPKFVPLGSNMVHEQHYDIAPSFQFGLTGLVMAAIILQSQQDDMRAATGARCMFYKGYTLFGTSRAIFQKLNAGSDAERLARLALIASGPKPAIGEIEP